MIGNLLPGLMISCIRILLDTQRLDVAFLYFSIEEHAGDDNGRKHGGDDAPHEGDCETVNGSSGHLPEDRARQCGGDVGIKNGPKCLKRAF